MPQLSGRRQDDRAIFKITYGDVKPFKGDLAKLSDLELAKEGLEFHSARANNAWRLRTLAAYCRNARPLARFLTKPWRF